jgi:hypothetical protein
MRPEIWGPILGAASVIVAAIIGKGTHFPWRRKPPTLRARTFVLGYRVGEIDFYLKLVEEAELVVGKVVTTPFQLAADDSAVKARAIASRLGWAVPEGAGGIVEAVEMQWDTLGANERAALELGRRIARISNGSLLLFNQIKEGDETVLVRSSMKASGETAIPAIKKLAQRAGFGGRFVEPVETFWGRVKNLPPGDRVSLDDHLRAIDDVRERLTEKAERAN